MASATAEAWSCVRVPSKPRRSPSWYPYEAFEPGVADQDAGTATHQRRPCQFINAVGDRPGLARRYM